MNIFEVATRKKFRFESVKGLLTVEHLWDLPLSLASPTRDVKADLDTVAKTINAQLKQAQEESFVKATTAQSTELTLKLEIVKHIIASKLEDQKNAEERNAKRLRRAKLLNALEAKDNAQIEGMSREDILKELESMD